ncbi:MAG: response regulator [Lachnospiraceae bacterium]|nr:response regulator [Lachnospiraceae bacterium]
MIKGMTGQVLKIASVVCLAAGIMISHPEPVKAGDNVPAENVSSNEQLKIGGGYAVTGQLKEAGYMAKLYNASNGLPTSDANYILGAGNGYVYIGGYSGVIRYDGNTFERLSSSDGLTSARVMFEDEKGRIWVGTNDNGVVVLDGYTRLHYTYEDGLASSSIRTFAVGSDGNTYIGSTSGISYVDQQGKLHRIDDDRINSEIIVRMVSDTNGRIYGNTNDGAVFAIDDTKVSQFYTSEEIGTETISTIFADPDSPGMVYLGTDANYLYYGSFGDGRDKLKRINVAPADSIYWITSECGRIWITAESVAGYIDTNNRFRVLNDIPMNNSIDMLTSDYQGNLWLASSRQGVMKVVTSNFRDYTEEAGLTLEAVNATCLCDGMLYIGTDTGMFILNEKMEKVDNILTEYLKGTRIRCITKDNDGKLWISAYTNDLGLVCYSKKDGIKNYTTKDGMPDNRARVIIIGDDGSVLTGTNGGLAIIKDGKVIRTVDSSSGINNSVFLTLCEADDGTVYVGTDGDGICVIDGDKISRIGRREGLTSDVILRIKKDDKRDLYWIITSNSLQYLKDGVITNVDSFPYNNNYDIFTDGSDNIWILSSMGLYSLNVQDILNNDATSYRLYTLANGLPCAPTANSFSELDEQGNLYIAGRTGVCLVNVNHFFDQEYSIKTGVKSVICNDERLLPDSEGVYTIPAVTGRIQIVPAILDYSMTNPLVHVYLEGTNEPGLRCEQSELMPLEYTNLGYGNYTLHIRVLDKATRKTIQDDTFRIVKTPRLSELFAFRFMCALLLVLFAGFIVWRFMRSTIIRRQYEEIRLAKEEAERANNAKSQFLANMSHEIRTPINTILGMNEMAMREDATDVPQAYHMSMMHYAYDIRNASESLLSLINDLLDMSKIESGKMRLVEQEYDTQGLLRSIVSMIRVRSAEKDLTFDVVVDEALPKRMYGDMGKIKQVVLNLLTNAVKYTEHGGFTLKVTVEGREGENCDLKFSVKDTGIGIKQEDMERLFTAYERLDEEKNSGIQGTGLGLDISRRFAELMGGKLSCTSVYGEGSEFVLSVKQKIVDEEPLGEFKEHEDHMTNGVYVPKFIAPDAHILVVDDNKMNLNVAKGLLKPTKIMVTTASSGKECLEKIKETKFDIIFLDHMMPGMDGIETMQKILEEGIDTPVYALTANATAGEEFYRSKGFTGYLSKPVDSIALEETIMAHLSKELIGVPDVEDFVREPEALPDELLWLNETEGISVPDGLKNSGSVPNYIESLELFLDTIDENLEVIKEAYDSGDMKMYVIKVHALKSSARLIGANKLSDLSASLEDAGNRDDKAYIDENTEGLLTMYSAFREKLSRLVPQKEEEAKEMIPAAELEDAYAALKEVVPQMDYDAVEMILDQLDSYTLPDEDDEKIKKIAKLLKRFDWGEIEDILGC